ncbi:MAG: carbohydrate porin [Aquificae bacterium]|nr:carbohydrate porin [Aquificota bacterium]
MKKQFIFGLVLFLSISVLAATVEERLQALEEKVRQLEERINQLEKKAVKEKKYRGGALIHPTDITDTITVSGEQKLIAYKPLLKKFKPARIKESLWQKSDQVVIKVAFKNNTGKIVSNITGKVVVFDKEGNRLAEKEVNINKALNFFKGTNIAPGETVSKKIAFDVDLRNEKHRKLKELPLEQLVVKFYPTKIEFADGSVKYIQYTGG